MDNNVLQSIFDRLQPILPERWEKMILYVAYTGGSYSMKFYTSDETGDFTDCFNQTGISKMQLIKLFMEINKILEPERKSLDDKNRWSVMTMIVETEGNVKVEFEYTDSSENTIEYENEWNEKYLHNYFDA